MRHARHRGGSVRRPIGAVEINALATENAGEDPHVLLRAATGMVVGKTERAADHWLVRWPDAEREPGTADGIDDRRDPVRLEQRMAGVGLEHRGAQLDPRRLPAGYGHRHERIAGNNARVPKGREAVSLGPLCLRDDLVDRCPATCQADAHAPPPSMCCTTVQHCTNVQLTRSWAEIRGNRWTTTKSSWATADSSAGRWQLLPSWWARPWRRA